MMVMDIKMEVVQRSFNIVGNLISDLLSKPDWESRKKNISQFYKDLEPVKSTLPDAPDVREIPEQRAENGKEKAKVDEIVNQICTPDLSPKELSECQECVREVIKNPDVARKYMEPSL